MDFKTKTINRSLIQSIARYSNWQPGGIKVKLNQSGVYAGAGDWNKFIYLALLTLGVCFLATGIIFFLAFNWADLHKFVKLGLVQGIIAVCIGLVSISKIEQRIKDSVLFGACLIVGALFAVFGQIYQTGATAYDFVLGWAVFTLIWALASRFTPLWLFLLVLINGAFMLYVDQVSSSFSLPDSYNILFAFNALVIIGLQMLQQQGKINSIPKWFIRIIAVAAIYFITVSLCYCIFDKIVPEGLTAVLLAVPVFFLAVKDAFKKKDVFYLCIIPLSIIALMVSLVFRLFDHDFNGGVLFLASVLVIGGVSFQISQVIQLNKKWNGIN